MIYFKQAVADLNYSGKTNECNSQCFDFHRLLQKQRHSVLYFANQERQVTSSL